MGRFEELVAEAKTGNLEAIDLLEQEFSGTTLRKTNEDLAKENEELRKFREANLDLVRKGTVENLIGQLDESLREGVTSEAFSGINPEELTLDRVREVAQQVQTQRRSVIEAAAKEAGFETVEEYQQALNAVKQQRQERQQGLEQLGGAASSGGESGSHEADEFSVAKKDYERAQQLGATSDEALGEFLHTRMTQQAPVELE